MAMPDERYGLVAPVLLDQPTPLFLRQTKKI
jgi:hypothetical protein